MLRPKATISSRAKLLSLVAESHADLAMESITFTITAPDCGLEIGLPVSDKPGIKVWAGSSDCESAWWTDFRNGIREVLMNHRCTCPEPDSRHY